LEKANATAFRQWRALVAGGGVEQPTVRRKEIVKILYRVIRDACRLADSGIEHKHIQSIADD
jgi:hypothetical protein